MLSIKNINNIFPCEGDVPILSSHYYLTSTSYNINYIKILMVLV